MTARSVLYLLAAVLASSLLASCTGSRLVATSAEDAYRRGAELYERGRYHRAAEQLLTVFDFGRAHEWAADAQFMLADAYFQTGQYLLAANEYDRFAQLYSGDPRVEDAYFRRAESFYQLSPGYQLDQKDTGQAINYLRLYASLYPGGEHVGEAGRMIDELQNKLAHKQFAAAELYERQRQYEAAALTYEGVLDQYPNSEWAPRAMVGAIRSFLQFAQLSVPSLRAQRLDRAIETYERLIQIFPDHPILKDAELLYEQALSQKRQLESPGAQEPEPISG